MIQFSLKTALTFTTGLAILLAQYPFVHQHGPNWRFVAVAVAEVVMLMGWACARQGNFPWKVMLTSAAFLLLTITMLVIVYLLVADVGTQVREILTALPPMLTLILSSAIFAIYVAYGAISWGTVRVTDRDHQRRTVAKSRIARR